MCTTKCLPPTPPACSGICARFAKLKELGAAYKAKLEACEVEFVALKALGSRILQAGGVVYGEIERGERRDGSKYAVARAFYSSGQNSAISGQDYAIAVSAESEEEMMPGADAALGVQVEAAHQKWRQAALALTEAREQFRAAYTVAFEETARELVGAELLNFSPP